MLCYKTSYLACDLSQVVEVGLSSSRLGELVKD